MTQPALTSAELMKQAQSIIDQAKEVRKTEMAEIIAGIQKTIADNGISAEDLGYLPMKTKRAKKNKEEEQTPPAAGSTPGGGNQEGSDAGGEQKEPLAGELQ